MNLTITEQLKAQNNGTGWIDCNQHGLPHRWAREPVHHYFRCERCPVVTRSLNPPERFL